jgi:hypothetical protein
MSAPYPISSALDPGHNYPNVSILPYFLRLRTDWSVYQLVLKHTHPIFDDNQEVKQYIVLCKAAAGEREVNMLCPLPKKVLTARWKNDHYHKFVMQYNIHGYQVAEAWKVTFRMSSTSSSRRHL